MTMNRLAAQKAALNSLNLTGKQPRNLMNSITQKTRGTGWAELRNPRDPSPKASNLDLPHINPASARHTSSLTVGSAAVSRSGRRAGNASYRQAHDTATHSNLSVRTGSFDDGGPKIKIKSVNGIEQSFKHIEKLFRDACKKVKEGFLMKKHGFEIPEKFQGHYLPVEALAFDRDILMLITKEMGIKLSAKQAIEAIYVAEKEVPG